MNLSFLDFYSQHCQLCPTDSYFKKITSKNKTKSPLQDMKQQITKN